MTDDDNLPERAIRWDWKTTTATFADSGSTVEVTMSYRTDDPFAVAFIFDPLGYRSVYVFARQLLVEALSYQAHETALVVSAARRNAATIDLTVRPARHAPVTLHFPAADVRAFLAKTQALVAIGHETVDWAHEAAVLGLDPSQVLGKAA